MRGIKASQRAQDLFDRWQELDEDRRAQDAAVLALYPDERDEYYDLITQHSLRQRNKTARNAPSAPVRSRPW